MPRDPSSQTRSPHSQSHLPHPPSSPNLHTLKTRRHIRIPAHILRLTRIRAQRPQHQDSYVAPDHRPQTSSPQSTPAPSRSPPTLPAPPARRGADLHTQARCRYSVPWRAVRTQAVRTRVVPTFLLRPAARSPRRTTARCACRHRRRSAVCRGR